MPNTDHPRPPRAIGYQAPDYYFELSPLEQSKIATLTPDFCVIRHPNQTDYFIRAVLAIPIVGYDQTFDYGPWTSLSQPSFEEYDREYHNEAFENHYFGFLSNQLHGYAIDTKRLLVSVNLTAGRDRPQLWLHETDHPLAREQREGITLQEAWRRVRAMG